MRSDGWHLTEDVDDFLTRAGDFLRSRPGSHVMQLTGAERVRARGADASGPEAPAFGVLERAAEVSATFYRLPPRALGLSPLTPEEAGSLAARLAALGHSFPASARTTTPPPFSPRAGSGTPARRRNSATHGSVCTASARSPHRSRYRRAGAASWASRTLTKSCSDAASSPRPSGKTSPSTTARGPAPASPTSATRSGRPRTALPSPSRA